MTVPGTSNGNFLGGIHGGYWSTTSQAQGYSAQAAHQTNLGTIGALFAQQAAVARPPIKDAGIRAGEIIAYRAWTWEGGLLRSMAANFAWIPGEIAHGVPSQGVGVHAFKTLGDTVGQYGSYGHSAERPIVFGTVALWGDVIEHEKGYRAEFGAVEAVLMVMPGDEYSSWWMFWKPRRDVLAEVRRTYGLATENREAA